MRRLSHVRDALTRAIPFFARATYACMLAASCVPPPPVGLIVPGPQKRGTVHVSAQGGGGGTNLVEADRPVWGGGGVAHVEAFASPRLSFPVSLSMARLWNAEYQDLGEDYTKIEWYAALRLGIRYRIGSLFSVGGGIGGSVFRGALTAHLSEEGPYARVSGDGHLDFEWSVGKRYDTVIVSFSQRLVWDGTMLIGFHIPSELTVALLAPRSRFALTFSAFMCLTIPAALWGGGTMGFALLL